MPISLWFRLRFENITSEALWIRSNWLSFQFHFSFSLPTSSSDAVAEIERNMKINAKAGKLSTLKYCIFREGNKKWRKARWKIIKVSSLVELFLPLNHDHWEAMCYLFFFINLELRYILCASCWWKLSLQISIVFFCASASCAAINSKKKIWDSLRCSNEYDETGAIQEWLWLLVLESRKERLYRNFPTWENSKLLAID